MWSNDGRGETAAVKHTNSGVFEVTSCRTLERAARLAVMAMLAAGFAGSAIAQGIEPATRSLTVTGQGEASAPPDQAQIMAGVQTVAATVIESTRQNQAAVEKIMRSLEDQGIEPADIQTSGYNVWAEQRHDPRGSGEITLTGYGVSNVVNVVVRDIDRVGEVLAAVTNAGANSIHGVQFMVEDTAALEQRARAEAMAHARAQAESLAELAGVELGEVLTISMSSGGGQPRPMGVRFAAQMAEAAPVPGISPGQLDVVVQVHVTFVIR